MSIEMDKLQWEIRRYLEEKKPETEEELAGLVHRFMDDYNAKLQNDGAPECDGEDVFDLLEQAENAKTKKAKRELIARALELEPENLDALLTQAEMDAKQPEQFLELLEPILALGKRQMEREGYFKNCTGDFWLVWETRPYMRARNAYFNILIELGCMKRAIREGEEMLRLSANDNLGIRYSLMHLYAFFEDDKKALRLHRKYGGYDETQMLLPLSVLYYKQGDLAAAESYLRRLESANSDTKRFFNSMVKGDPEADFERELSPYGYRPGKVDELIVCLAENDFLYDSSSHFFNWANELLKPKRKSKKG